MDNKITPRQPGNNRTTITFKGRTQTIQEWADELGYTFMGLHYRIRAGWDIEDILTLPPMRRTQFCGAGAKKRMEESKRAFGEDLL